MARPIAVTIVSGFLWIGTLISLVVGVALVLPGTVLDRMWAYNRPAHETFQKAGELAGVGFLVLGLVVGATAAGLTHGRLWAWRLAILVFALDAAGDLINLLLTRDLLRSFSGFVVSLGFLLALLQSDVRGSFTRRAR